MRVYLHNHDDGILHTYAGITYMYIYTQSDEKKLN